MMLRVIASRTASAPCPASAGPFFVRGASPCPARRGRCSSIAKRVVRSTNVPIAELSRPRMRSPSQCPGTARSAASAGGWLAMISGETKPLPRLRTRALDTRNTRPVRKQISSDPGRGCDEAHGFAVAAVQREGDAHAFAIIAGHLEAVGTPSQVRLGDGDAAVVATLGPTSMTLEQEAVPLHYRVHALMVRGLPAFRTGSAAEDRLHPAVAVGRQIGDNAFDLADEVLVRLRPATDKLPLGVLRP